MGLQSGIGAASEAEVVLVGREGGRAASRSEGTAEQQGIVLVHQALGDTFRYIHLFTR